MTLIRNFPNWIGVSFLILFLRAMKSLLSFWFYFKKKKKNPKIPNSLHLDMRLWSFFLCDLLFSSGNCMCIGWIPLFLCELWIFWIILLILIFLLCKIHNSSDICEVYYDLSIQWCRTVKSLIEFRSLNSSVFSWIFYWRDFFFPILIK